MHKKEKLKFRHEWKYQINALDREILRHRLRNLISGDSHSVDGGYRVKSLYFDTLGDKALREKIDGVNCREKFRIRYYEDNTDFIRLEKKSKVNGLCNKQSERIQKEEVEAILHGNIEWMAACGRPLLQELYAKMKGEGLHPVKIVQYDREAFVYAPGNVRVTLDYNIRIGIDPENFLMSEYLTIPAEENAIILEVKWDEFLPDIIRMAVALDSRRVGAFSKYAACRVYG
ncbi:MAG: polyphosphate polymerase domain-containing protein [Eubacteriales bacterium]|nr:polyphosphate polymerase domain-containing protein [Eubacteriales bacterium]